MGKNSDTGAVAESKVAGIIKSLGALENDLDSLGEKAGDMKKQLAAQTQSQIESAIKQTREMATKEAMVIIDQSKKEAQAESKGITERGEARLAEVQAAVDSNFDDAVKDVVATILKP